MNVDLNNVLDLLINEGEESASGLLRQWFVGQAKTVIESQMQEDDAVLEGDDQTQDIEQDQDAIESEEYYSEAEGDDEAEAGEAPVDADSEIDLGLDPVDGAEPEAIEDKVQGLEADLARLKAEFQALIGVEEPEHNLDLDGDGEVAGDPEGLDEPSEEPVQESDEFAELDESFQLEPVADPGLSGGKEIGADGAAVHLNDKSPIPQKKGEARVGGAAVEINAKEHKGYAREAAPEVNKSPLLKNQVKNAKADLEGVSKEGDSSAMLNKKTGFGSDSPKSPIGAGAADLRGSDLKRK